MSHTVKIDTKFTQFDDLKTAFEHFGWTIKEKSKARTYPSDPAQNTVYDFVAVNPNNGYDLGITLNGEEIGIFGDFYGGSVASTLGNGLDKLKQEYAYRVIESHFAYNGASVTRAENEDGTQTVDVEFAG